jgi:hypothetical protein
MTNTPITTTVYGQRLGIYNDQPSGKDYLTGNAVGGLRFPGYGNDAPGLTQFDPAYGSMLFDDYLGDALDARWSGAAGTDPQAVAPAINMQVGGVVRLVSGDTTVVAESLSSLTHGLNYRAQDGELIAQARIKLVGGIVTQEVFFGFTDVLATTTLELPFSISGTTVTSNATDAVGFLFDTDATTDVWNCLGVKADADATRAQTTVAPVADAWVVLTLKVDKAGHAKFYIDGTYVGKVDNAVTATAALTPILCVMTRTTATRTVDADYIYTAKARG